MERDNVKIDPSSRSDVDAVEIDADSVQERLQRTVDAARHQLERLDQRARTLGTAIEPNDPVLRQRHYAVLGVATVALVVALIALVRTF